MEYCIIKKEMYACVYKHFVKLLVSVQIMCKYVAWAYLYKNVYVGIDKCFELLCINTKNV